LVVETLEQVEVVLLEAEDLLHLVMQQVEMVERVLQILSQVQLYHMLVVEAEVV